MASFFPFWKQRGLPREGGRSKVVVSRTPLRGAQQSLTKWCSYWVLAVAAFAESFDVTCAKVRGYGFNFAAPSPANACSKLPFDGSAFTSNAVSSRRRSAQTLLTLASISAQVCSVTRRRMDKVTLAHILCWRLWAPRRKGSRNPVFLGE